MSRIFLSLFGADVHRKRGIILILLSGIVISMYCICAMLGVAVSEYETAKTWNDYTTLIVNPGEVHATENSKMIQLLDRTNDEDIQNVIYLTRYKNGIYVIGWDGTQQTQWFPHSSGRFFTEEEIKTGEKLAYVSEGYQTYDKSKEIELAGEIYQVIGVGWMVTYNFSSMIPDESKVHLFTEETPYDNPGSGKTREEYFKFIIIPVSCYLENYQPDQILVQISHADTRKMKEYKKILENEVPGIQVCLPARTAEVRLEEKTVVYIRKSLVLSIVAGLTLLQLVIQWVKLSTREFSVYYLCGLTFRSILWMIYGRLLCYYFIGGIIAAFIHRLTLPILQFIYQDEVPSYTLLALMLIFVFLIISIGTLPFVYKEVRGIREARRI